MINIPISYLVQSYEIPDSLIKLVDGIFFNNFSIENIRDNWRINLSLCTYNEALIEEVIFPSENSSITISLKSLSNLIVDKYDTGYVLRYAVSKIQISLPPFFRKARIEGSNIIVIEASRATIDIDLTNKYVGYDISDGISFFSSDFTTYNPVFNTLFIIGETGIGIQLENLDFDISEKILDISIKKARIYLPNILNFLPDIEFNNGKINKDGFSGEIMFDWDLELSNGTYKMNGNSVKLFDTLNGGLDSFAITFENNVITGCNITGEILIPFFNDKPLRISLQLDDNGNNSIRVESQGNVDMCFTKDEILQLYLQNLEFDTQTKSLSLSGSLQPLLFAKDGLQWPKMEVKNLRIDSNGKISIDEAWMDLREIANLDLWGFNIELRKLGFGISVDERMWLDWSGSIRLVEQLPLGLDMEGFRISWPTNINLSDSRTVIQELQKIQIQFRGIDINFAIPKTVKIDGLIRFFKDAQKVGFAGDMKLAVIPAGFTAEAGMLVGMNTQTPAFPFVYVYFGFESTAGIPLAQTGLALKGAMGLIGINVVPTIDEVNDPYLDWYKGAPGIGAHQTSKWKPEPGGFAIGIGVTISTADGVVKKTKGLLVLSFPGPMLLINGAAFLLDTGSGDGEPPFTATAMFMDNSIRFNLEAQAEIVKDMVYASADVEAYFDFNDITNWHLYLGVDQPESRRVNANVLNIFKADAYLMLDMIDADSSRMRAGVFIDIEPDIPDLVIKDPSGNDFVKIVIDAWLNIEGTGQVSINPEQFSGTVDIDGGLTVSAFGLTFGPTVEAHLDINGPTPFRLKGDLDFTLEMWPEDYHNSAEVDFSSDFKKKTRKTPKLTIINPVQTITLFSRFNDESKMLPLYGDNKKSLPVENSHVDGTDKLSERTICELCPVVPVDSNPVIAFNQSMNNDNQNINMKFMMHPGGNRKKYKVGKVELEPTVMNIEIFRRKKGELWDADHPWEIIYATNNESGLKTKYRSTYSINLVDELWGAWLADSDTQSPGEPGSRRLQLLTDNPLINTARSYTMEGGPLLKAATSNIHLSEQVLEDYPGLMFNRPEIDNTRCVKFIIEPGKIVSSDRNGELIFQKLLFISEPSMEIVGCNDMNADKNCNCLHVKGMVDIYFPEEVESCTITYCSDIKKEGKEITDPENSKKEKQESNIANVGTNDKKYKKETITFYDVSGTKIGDPEDFKRGSQNSYNNADRLCKRIRIIANPFFINEICYTIKNDISDPPAMPDEDFKKILDPGYYYRINIESRIKGVVSVDQNLIKNPLSGRIPGIDEYINLNQPLYDDYHDSMTSRSALGGNSRQYNTVTYFQTSSPPNNLAAYVKWTYPNQEMNRIYLDDDILVCFKRNYLKALFDGEIQGWENFRMSAFIIDANNNIYPRKISWGKSGSTTRFQDEETWDINRDDNNAKVKYNEDDLIIISKDGTNSLPKNQRCNLILTGGDGGRTLIPPILEAVEMDKYWKDFAGNWNYDKGVFSTNNNTGKLTTAIENYENIELIFEAKGSDFYIMFRSKKNGSSVIEYWISISLNRITEIGLNGIGYGSKISSRSNIDNVQNYLKSANDDNNPVLWRKYKVRVVGNKLNMFLENNQFITDFDLHRYLHKTTVNINGENAELKVDYNINGAVSLSPSNCQFRNIELRDAELLRIPFYTTGFANREALFNTLKDSKNPVTMVAADKNYEKFRDLLQKDSKGKLEDLEKARLNYYLVQKDYEYNMARYPLQGEHLYYSREAVEKFTLELREKESVLDSFFKETLLLNLFPQQMFHIPEKGMSLSLLCTETNTGKTIRAIYIQSREKLYPQPKFTTTDPHASTQIAISFNNKNVIDKNGIIYNNDGDQVLIATTAFEVKKGSNSELLMEVKIYLNHEDDNAEHFAGTQNILNKHHRYDRAVIMCNGSSSKSVKYPVKIPIII